MDTISHDRNHERDRSKPNPNGQSQRKPYSKPLAHPLNLKDEIDLFKACNSWANDSASCY